jgi:hypothetical protein
LQSPHEVNERKKRSKSANLCNRLITSIIHRPETL